MNTAFKSTSTRLAGLVAGMVAALALVFASQASAQTASTTGTSTNTISASVTGTSTATTTATTTASTTLDVVSLQALVVQLENQVTWLENQLATLQAEFQSWGQSGSGSTGSGNGTTTSATSTGSTSSPMTNSAKISPQSAQVRAGTSVDFTGSGFWANEPVRVMNNGTVVTTAQADGGGNFSTGSLRVPLTTGSQSYTFTGESSGMTATATADITS